MNPIVSTTKVSSSQWPTECPIQLGSVSSGSRCSAPSGGGPDGTPELYKRLDEAQLAASSAESAERYFTALSDFDLSDEIGRIRARTLICHGTEETGVPFAGLVESIGASYGERIKLELA